MSEVIRKNNPTPSDVHINVPLTNMALAYRQLAPRFVASRIFPAVGVQKQSDSFYKWDKNTFLTAYAKPRAPSSESAGGQIAFSTDTYAADVFAYHFDVDDRTLANADSQLGLEAAAAEHVMGALLREKERQFIANFFKGGTWGKDYTGKASVPSTNEFLMWNKSGSTPRADIETGKTYMIETTGHEPNTLLLGRQVYTALLSCADVKDQFKYTSAESINEAMVARYFGVDNLLVSDAIWNSTGTTYTFMAGKGALLAYVAPSAGQLVTSAGYTFEWSGYTGAVGGVRMSRIRADLIKSTRIEGEYAYDMKMVSQDLGVYYIDTVS